MRKHMRPLILALAACAALALGGCYTLSMNPLYAPKDIVYEKGLEGVWGNPDAPDDETWEFRNLQSNTYRLVVREEGNRLIVDPAKDGLFQAHLVKLGRNTFLDVYPEEPAGVNEFYASHVVPAHSFAKVSLEGNALTISFMDANWIKKLAKEGRLDLRYERRDDVIVLTAPTEELQRFVLEHVDEAFEEPQTVKRLQ